MHSCVCLIVPTTSLVGRVDNGGKIDLVGFLGGNDSPDNVSGRLFLPDLEAGHGLGEIGFGESDGRTGLLGDPQDVAVVCRNVFRVQIGRNVGKSARLERRLVVGNGSHFREIDSVVDGCHVFLAAEDFFLHDIGKDHPATGSEHSCGFGDGEFLSFGSDVQQGVHAQDNVGGFVTDGHLEAGFGQDLEGGGIVLAEEFLVEVAGLGAHAVGNIASGGLPDESFLVEPADESTVSASHVDDAESVVSRNSVFFRQASFPNVLDDLEFVEFLGLEDLFL